MHRFRDPKLAAMAEVARVLGATMVGTYTITTACSWSGMYNGAEVSLSFTVGTLTPSDEQQYALDNFVVPAGFATNPNGQTGPGASPVTPATPTPAGWQLTADGAGNTVWTAPGSYVSKPNTSILPYLHRAIANVVSGLQDRKVLFIGDSITYGYSGYCGVGALGMLANILTAAGVQSQVGLAIPNAQGAAGTDSRWTVGGAWSLWNLLGNNGISWGGNPSAYLAGSGAGANGLKYTPGTLCDTFDIYYLMGPSSGTPAAIYGTFNANIDSGTNTPVSCSSGSSGPLQVGKTTITTASASTSHVCQIGSTSVSNVVIIGIEARLSVNPSPTLRLSNAGVYGTTTAAWTALGPSNEYQGIDPVSCIKAYAPDVMVLGLGVNDAGGSVSVATYLANLLTLITAAKLSGDVILWDPLPSVSSSGKVPLETAYAAALPAFALTNGCGFFSVWNEWGGAGGQAELSGPGYYLGDGIHPSTNVGYPDLARIFAGALAEL